METMGMQSFQQLKQETPLVEDPAINRYVQCVADAITALPQVQQYSRDWDVQVFDQDMVNAFALPGGHIGVYKGLLSVAENADQLAAVMGHEVAHVLAQHGNERVSQNLAVNQTLALLENWMAANNTAYRQQAMGLLGVGAQVGVLLPFSRVHESEADEIGQTLMAKAGFDPRASVALWQNMAKVGGDAPPEFLSTHPTHETRIDQLQAGMDAAMQHYRAVSDKPACTPPPL
jgi:predicted Zn-dependent protease